MCALLLPSFPHGLMAHVFPSKAQWRLTMSSGARVAASKFRAFSISLTWRARRVRASVCSSSGKNMQRMALQLSLSSENIAMAARSSSRPGSSSKLDD